MAGLSASFFALDYGGSSQSVNCIIIGFVLMFMFCFSVGMSSTPWVINSEIYPVIYNQMSIRSIANSVSTTANWCSNFVVSMTFAYFLDF